MTQMEIRKLRKGDFVIHKAYGLCIVFDYLYNTGAIICPLTAKGMYLLTLHSGKYCNRLLENSQKALIRKVENPVIPLIIIKENNLFHVKKWNTLGEVSTEGRINATLLKSFNTLEEAYAFVELHEKPLKP